MRQVVRTLLKNAEWKYLLVQHHNSDIWTTPGGHIDEGEPMHKALKREIKEEFNLKIKFLGERDDFWVEHIKSYPTPLSNYKIYYTSKKFWKVKKWEYMFHCEIKGYNFIKVQEKEIKDFAWMNPEEIFALENIYPQIPVLLKKALQSS